MHLCHASAIFLAPSVPGCRMAHILAEGNLNCLGCTGMILGEAKVHRNEPGALLCTVLNLEKSRGFKTLYDP